MGVNSLEQLTITAQSNTPGKTSLSVQGQNSVVWPPDTSPHLGQQISNFPGQWKTAEKPKNALEDSSELALLVSVFAALFPTAQNGLNSSLDKIFSCQGSLCPGFYGFGQRKKNKNNIQRPKIFPFLSESLDYFSHR